MDQFLDLQGSLNAYKEDSLRDFAMGFIKYMEENQTTKLGSNSS